MLKSLWTKGQGYDPKKVKKIYPLLHTESNVLYLLDTGYLDVLWKKAGADSSDEHLLSLATLFNSEVYSKKCEYMDGSEDIVGSLVSVLDHQEAQIMLTFAVSRGITLPDETLERLLKQPVSDSSLQLITALISPQNSSLVRQSGVLSMTTSTSPWLFWIKYFLSPPDQTLVNHFLLWTVKHEIVDPQALLTDLDKFTEALKGQRLDGLKDKIPGESVADLWYNIADFSEPPRLRFPSNISELPNLVIPAAPTYLNAQDLHFRSLAAVYIDLSEKLHRLFLRVRARLEIEEKDGKVLVKGTSRYLRSISHPKFEAGKVSVEVDEVWPDLEVGELVYLVGFAKDHTTTCPAKVLQIGSHLVLSLMGKASGIGHILRTDSRIQKLARKFERISELRVESAPCWLFGQEDTKPVNVLSDLNLTLKRDLFGDEQPAKKPHSSEISLSGCRLELGSDPLIESYQLEGDSFGTALNCDQSEAVLRAVRHGLTVVDGPVCTGKSLVAKSLLHLIVTNFPGERTLVVVGSEQAKRSFLDIKYAGDLGNPPDFQAIYSGLLAEVQKMATLMGSDSKIDSYTSSAIFYKEYLEEPCAEFQESSVNLIEVYPFKDSPAESTVVEQFYKHLQVFKDLEKLQYVETLPKNTSIGLSQYLNVVVSTPDDLAGSEAGDFDNFVVLNSDCLHLSDLVLTGFLRDTSKRLVLVGDCSLADKDSLVSQLSPTATVHLSTAYNLNKALDYFAREKHIHRLSAGGFQYPVQFIDSSSFSSEIVRGDQRQNVAEAEYLGWLFAYMQGLGCAAEDIGVVTAYSLQKMLLQEVLRQHGDKIPTVVTFEELRGLKFRHLLVSFVRTSSEKGLPFQIRSIQLVKRLTSAATESLYMIGSLAVFSFEPFKTLIQNEGADLRIRPNSGKVTKVSTLAQLEKAVKSQK